MYSLTFRVCVTTPLQYGRNGMAHAGGVSMLSPAKGVFAGMRSVCVRHACGGPDRLPLGSATPSYGVANTCHSNTTRAPIANLPNSPQLGGIPYHSPKLYPGPWNSEGMRPWTDTQTDTQTRLTTIHFSWFDTVGWVIWPAKTVPELTYNVFSGTLNPTHSLVVYNSREM